MSHYHVATHGNTSNIVDMTHCCSVYRVWMMIHRRMFNKSFRLGVLRSLILLIHIVSCALSPAAHCKGDLYVIRRFCQFCVCM